LDELWRIYTRATATYPGETRAHANAAAKKLKTALWVNRTQLIAAARELERVRLVASQLLDLEEDQRSWSDGSWEAKRQELADLLGWDPKGTK
jgi:hypothetical protein